MDCARPESSSEVDDAVIVAFLEKSWSYLTCPDPLPPLEKSPRARSRDVGALVATRRKRGKSMYWDLMAAA